MRRFVTVDIVCGLGAFAYGFAAHLWLPELGELVDSRVAVGFGLLALGRWYGEVRVRDKRGSQEDA